MPFLKGDLPYLVDAVATRYNLLPTQLLELDVDEFNLNVAIYNKAVLREIELRKKMSERTGKVTRTDNTLNFNGWPIKRNIMKKPKVKK